MAKVISFANHKGGVGKTTTTLNVGAALATLKKKVLLIDLDAQANLTTSLLSDEPEAEQSIYYSLIGNSKTLPIVETSKNLSLVPSSSEMASIELEIASKMDREYILKELLEPHLGNYDYILLDCPPSFGLITLNALVSSTDLYVPLTAETLPTRGLKKLSEVLEMVKKRANPGLELSGVVITRYEKNNLSLTMEEVIRDNFKSKVFNTRIRKNIVVAESPLMQQSVIEYAPNSNGAKDYLALAKEILN